MKPQPVNYWHMIVWPCTIALVVVTVVMVAWAVIEANRG